MTFELSAKAQKRKDVEPNPDFFRFLNNQLEKFLFVVGNYLLSNRNGQASMEHVVYRHVGFILRSMIEVSRDLSGPTIVSIEERKGQMLEGFEFLQRWQQLPFPIILYSSSHKHSVSVGMLVWTSNPNTSSSLKACISILAVMVDPGFRMYLDLFKKRTAAREPVSSRTPLPNSGNCGLQAS